MNYAENNVCCVNQYQIPGALKLPLEATMHFVFFSLSLGKIPTFFSSPGFAAYHSLHQKHQTSAFI